MPKYPKCNACGSSMTEFDGVAMYTCPDCGNFVRDNGDGTWSTAADLFPRAKGDIDPEDWQAFEDGWRPDRD